MGLEHEPAGRDQVAGLQEAAGGEGALDLLHGVQRAGAHHGVQAMALARERLGVDVAQAGGPRLVRSERLERLLALGHAQVELPLRELALHPRVEHQVGRALRVQGDVLPGAVLAVEPQEVAGPRVAHGVRIHDPALHADEAPLSGEGRSHPALAPRVEAEERVRSEGGHHGDRGRGREPCAHGEVPAEEEVQTLVHGPSAHQRREGSHRVVEPGARGGLREGGQPAVEAARVEGGAQGQAAVVPGPAHHQGPAIDGPREDGAAAVVEVRAEQVDPPGCEEQARTLSAPPPRLRGAGQEHLPASRVEGARAHRGRIGSLQPRAEGFLAIPPAEGLPCRAAGTWCASGRPQA